MFVNIEMGYLLFFGKQYPAFLHTYRYLTVGQISLPFVKSSHKVQVALICMNPFLALPFCVFHWINSLFNKNPR